ncbi:MAG: signal transduction histidine kinase, partial [Urechidicola sp.]
HKGSVSVASQEGQGTTFSVRIPFNRVTAAEDQE